jgi:hypothetical protein
VPVSTVVQRHSRHGGRRAGQGLSSFVIYHSGKRASPSVWINDGVLQFATSTTLASTFKFASRLPLSP